MSAKNPYLRKARNQIPRSYYLEYGYRKEHSIGQNLREWLNEKESQGWKICSPRGAKELAESVIRRLVRIAARKVRPDKRGRFRRGLMNFSHSSKLYISTSICQYTSPQTLVKLTKTAKKAFNSWKTPMTRKCIEKRGKPEDPESEDFTRLAEAIHNKRKSRRHVIFVTGDSHFLCHADSIYRDFDIEIHGFR